MKTKLNLILRYTSCIFMLFIALNYDANAQPDKVLNSYNNQTEITAPVSITLKDGFYIPAGKNVRIYTTGISFKECMPFSGTPNINQNYISTKIFKIAGVLTDDDVNAGGRNTCEVNQTIQYFDGLGRPLQTIITQGSPTFKDLVQPIAYDVYGRENKKYLPYTVSGNGGYQANALTAQQQFYNSPVNGIKQITNSAFSETIFEASPLNRPVDQGAPGVSWQIGAGHAVRLEYGNNNTSTNYSTDGFAVRFYTAVAETLPGQQHKRRLELGGNGFYAANQLHLNVIKNENWIPSDGKAGTIEEYKDKDGQLVLKRTFNYNNGNTEVLSTYYVNDDLGRLSFVIPPGTNPDAGVIVADVLENFCYEYRYDGKGRLTEKKIPGKGWEFRVYNNLDQVILIQDANQRKIQQWQFTKYDGLGRIASSGTYSDGSSQGSIQTNVNAETTLWETRTGTDYDGASFPRNNIDLLIVNYYDNYNIQGIPDHQNLAFTTKLKGLMTSNKVKVMGTTNDYLWTVNYYDEKSQIVKIYKQHYFGGSINSSNYDEVNHSYNFAGELIASIRSHHAGPNTISISNRYEFDHMGRKLASFESINTGQEVVLNKQDYNEVGQTIKKSVHSTDGSNFLQHNNYGYNERGWISQINDPDHLNTNEVFGMILFYGNKPNSFNGNIGGVKWKTKVPPGMGLTENIQSFDYDYDKLNRLKNSNYNTQGAVNKFNEELSYDLMGNILTLKRKNNISGYLNEFSYNYTSGGVGNKLWAVTDLGSAAQSSSYSYDDNGNQITDSRKGINIVYNLLNLPKVISKPGSGESLVYVYDASGQKLRKTYNGGGRDYIAGVEYNNGVLEFVQTEEGRAIPGSAYSYEYMLKDHLGNIRAALKQNGEIVQVQDYYAFGLEMNQSNTLAPSPANYYKYSGKEKQGELGLDQLDYGARLYDPVIGRWNAVDVLSQMSRRWSPYNFAMNNPIRLVDPDGMGVKPINGGFSFDGEDALEAFSILQAREAIKNNQNKLRYTGSIGIITFGKEKVWGQAMNALVPEAIVRNVSADKGRGGYTDFYNSLKSISDESPNGIGFLAIFSHGGVDHNPNRVTYNEGMIFANADLHPYADNIYTSDMKKLGASVEAGDVRFSLYSIIYLGACNASTQYRDGKSFAMELAKASRGSFVYGAANEHMNAVDPNNNRNTQFRPESGGTLMINYWPWWSPTGFSTPAKEQTIDVASKARWYLNLGQ